MHGRKAGILTAVAAAMLLFGGCGADGQMTEEARRGVTDWYNDMISGDGGTMTSGGDAYWDGYGINSNDPTTGNNTERNTYGMQAGNANGNTMGGTGNGGMSGGNTTNGNATGNGGSGNAGNAGSGNGGMSGGNSNTGGTGGSR